MFESLSSQQAPEPNECDGTVVGADYAGRPGGGITVTADLTWRPGAGGPRGRSGLQLYALTAGDNHPAPPKKKIGWRRASAGPSVVHRKNRGDLTSAPFVEFLNDSERAGFARLRITMLNRQRFVALLAHQKRGAHAFSELGATVTIADDVTKSLETRVEIPLRQDGGNRFWMVAAVLDFRAPRGYTIRTADRCFLPQEKARPVLYTDGTIMYPDGRILMGSWPREYER
ncbi:hypothetical protein [Actinoallomurus sp. NPDC052274]|uniref:hypothetical protein n=1 Tax=Actinoallomurus sp. NPDC052274 TaxID=3155420 RepID=UPI00343FCE4A